MGRLQGGREGLGEKVVITGEWSDIPLKWRAWGSVRVWEEVLVRVRAQGGREVKKRSRTDPKLLLGVKWVGFGCCISVNFWRISFHFFTEVVGGVSVVMV